ncbi:lysoplasmalogenase family protein [Flavivirga eckloniae]|uniref:Lysoplasmalogenase n=1 Tax=Flavivirga eckloniae TaxID=1803846 RepID=A0A2K9PUS5_9FLAO|nr:lysoplasmalogenase family protein [Flavivirga eckloniae]AUP80804.1 hypothetical protein C1H87_19645 [Flavivirga eckloniae]
MKLNPDMLAFRFISKSLVTILLLGYYLVNNKEQFKIKRIFTVCALLFFLVGDVFLIIHTQAACFVIGTLCFIFGKVFYAFRFSNKRDFSLLKLFPFLAFCFIYLAGFLILIYKNLDSYFFLILLYLFAAMTTIAFAYLRKGEVSLISYKWVLIGIIFSILSDNITALRLFYDSNFAYHSITIMLFYGLSQYFIILGIVKETNFSFEKKKFYPGFLLRRKLGSS